MWNKAVPRGWPEVTNGDFLGVQERGPLARARPPAGQPFLSDSSEEPWRAGEGVTLSRELMPSPLRHKPRPQAQLAKRLWLVLLWCPRLGPGGPRSNHPQALFQWLMALLLYVG